jgi:plasmid stabilization system protein ParE
MIYYLADERKVAVIRLLHKKMDPAIHLRPAQ